MLLGTLGMGVALLTVRVSAMHVSALRGGGVRMAMMAQGRVVEMRIGMEMEIVMAVPGAVQMKAMHVMTVAGMMAAVATRHAEHGHDD